MAYEVVLSRKAEKFLAGLRDERLRSRIEEALDGLSQNPRPAGAKQLTASDGIQRIRVGDFRILYTIQDTRLLVLVLDIANRREAYR